jgi:hypothetical protein
MMRGDEANIHAPVYAGGTSLFTWKLLKNGVGEEGWGKESNRGGWSDNV